MSKKIQKIVSITTSVATIAWISGIGMLAPLAASAVTINEGDTIKTADNPDVYIAKYVGSKTFKRLILNPEVFNSYGHLSWSKIKTVTQAEMDSFTNSDLVRALGDYKVYKLTPNGDIGTKQWLNMTAEQFTAAGYDWDSIYTINNTDRDNYTTGTDITSGVSSGTLAVALASNTAPAGTVVDGQSIAPLASFTFTAPSNSAVKITTFKAKRIGVSADATLTNVYLYDGVTRLTDSASVSSGIITWNNSAGIFTVPAGTTKTITLKSDIDGSAGETVGVSLYVATYIVTDGATVTGTFPINGNYMTLATATLATVDFGAITPATDGAPAPQNDFALWQSTLTIGIRAVNLSSIAFRQIGSVNNSDLANFKLMIDGVQVGSTISALDANGYITFDLTASPKKLETGSRVFKVMVDIVGGSTRTTSLSLRYAADINVVDTEYDANILVTDGSAAFSAQTSYAQTISAGTITFTKKTDTAQGNVVKGASNVSLAKFEVKAAGESIKIESLQVAIHTSTNANGALSLRNGALYANGVQIGSTASIRADNEASGNAYTQYNLGSSLIVIPGTPVILDVKADVFDDQGTNEIAAGVTLRVDILAGATNAQRMTSLSFFAAPTALTSGNTLTVKTGTLTLSKYTGYADHSAVPPQTATKMGEWRLTADTVEDVNLTTLAPTWATGSTNSSQGLSNVSDVYFTYGTQTTAVKSTIASTTTFSINSTLGSGQTIAIAMYGTVNSTISGIITPTLEVDGTTVGSAATANSTTVAGQSVTWTTGSISGVALETPLDQQVYGGQTVEVANYRFTAVSDSYTLGQLALTVVSGAEATIDSVWLYDGSTLLNPTGAGTPMNATYATTTGMSLLIPANGSKTITVKLKLNSIGTGGAAANLNASTTLVSALVANSAGTQSYVNPTAVNGEGNAVYVFKSYPVVTMTGTQALTITNDSTQSIFKFTVTPSAGGEVALKQFKIDLAWADAGYALAALELEAVKLFRGTTDITSTMTIKEEDASADITDNSGAVEATSQMIFTFTTEEQISSATEYVVKAIPREFDKSTTSTDSVVLTLSNDALYSPTYKYLENLGIAGAHNGIFRLATAIGGGSSVADENFIWSDRDLIGHNYASGTSSSDWFNGFAVKNLPLDSVTLKP